MDRNTYPGCSLPGNSGASTCLGSFSSTATVTGSRHKLLAALSRVYRAATMEMTFISVSHNLALF